MTEILTGNEMLRDFSSIGNYKIGRNYSGKIAHIYFNPRAGMENFSLCKRGRLGPYSSLYIYSNDEPTCQKCIEIYRYQNDRVTEAL